jgi:hypothetical protein
MLAALTHLMPVAVAAGEHTRAIRVSTPSAGLGGIMQFAHKTLKCMGCKAALPPGQSTLCKNCKGKEAELYIKSLQLVCPVLYMYLRAIDIYSVYYTVHDKVVFAAFP